MSKTASLLPRLTEKTYGLSSAASQVYVFDVETSANKHSVARAVEAQFEVKVTSVNIANNKGKAKRTIAKKGRKVYSGKEAASKKAYVTLKPGDSLPFFAAIEEEEKKQEKTQAQMEKAMEKQEAKEAKASAKSKSTVDKAPAATEEAKPRHRFHLGGRRGKQEEK